jgi:type I restriction enzyme, S subunit
VRFVPGNGQQAIADFLDRETERIDQLLTNREVLRETLVQRWLSEVWHAVTKGTDRATTGRASRLDWVGEIPDHWSVQPLYALFDVQLGKMLNPERAAGEHQAPYLRNVNVQWDRLELEDLDTMSFDAADRLRYRLLPGDLLVCEGGEVGRAAVWNGEIGTCFYQKAIHRVRARGDDSTRFLMYLLRAAATMDVFAVEGNRATIVHLTAEQLREHRFPFPQPREQEEIVAYLDNRGALVRRLTATVDTQLSLLAERRQALITAAVTGQLDAAE